MRITIRIQKNNMRTNFLKIIKDIKDFKNLK